MNHKKVKEIIKFSLYKDLQNRWFIIFNILTLVSVIAALNWGNFSSFIKMSDEDDVFEVSILDEENVLYDEFYNDLSGDTNYNILRITANTFTADNIPDNFMVIETQSDEKEAFKVSIISKEGINRKIYDPIVNEISKIRNKMLAEKYELTEDTLSIVQSDLSVNRIMLSVEANNSDAKEIIKLISATFTYVVMLLLFSKIANEISSEKQSKSTEYVLTTVSAKEYLFAKIFSNVIILLIQGLLLLMYYFIAALILNATTMQLTDFSLTSTINVDVIDRELISYILTILVFSVLNLILISIVQAVFAAKTSSMSEAGNTTALITFIVMAAYIISTYVIDPHAKVSLILYIASCLPVLSAFFIPSIMVIGQATLLQIIFALALLVIAIPITFHYCSIFFKNGILDYTKTKKNKKVLKPEETLKSEEVLRREILAKREMKEFGFVIGIAIIIYVGTQAIFSLLGNAVLSSLLRPILNNAEISLVLQILLQMISLGLASCFVFAYSNDNNSKFEKRNISNKTKVKLVLIALFLVFLLQVILSIVIYPTIGLDYDATDMFAINSSSRLISKILLVITLAVMPAIFEELFFRKAIINFSIKYGKTFALVFSALLFGLIHMNLSQGLFAFIMGLLFGMIYIYTNDIKLTMLIHFINNGFAALELILPGMVAIAGLAVLMIVLIIGFILFIKMIINKETRNRIISICNTSVNIQSFNEKYKYIFMDYTFDVALVLVFLMSIMSEKIMRAL